MREYEFFFFFFLFFATSLTVAYRVRLTLFASFGVLKISRFLIKREEEINFIFPLMILGFGAIFGGYLFYFFIFEIKCGFFFSSYIDKVFIIFILIFGVFLGIFFFFYYLNYEDSYKKIKFLTSFGGRMWFLQILRTQRILFYPFIFFFFNLYKIDRGLLEIIGGQGVMKINNFFFFFL